MWFVVRLFGVEVFSARVGGPPPATNSVIAHTDGSFELAPPELPHEDEEWEEEYRFGFR